ncbi:hypothetical protein P879_00109 [Paragonimus westermani]|uniref:SH2 domain-containing protein n=1 Tax=Paragonimus westermani TaxID=34504 RepID=A0A8T0DS99_9TREM|nr:hypothetical protein P879_00109 [Paragonimus westermani]
MFEQMVKDMYIPPDISAQLTDEQKDVLHYEIRQEQIRRYNEWQKSADNSGGTPRSKRKLKIAPKKKKGKHVTFEEGPDGRLIVQRAYIDEQPAVYPMISSVPPVNGPISIIRPSQNQEWGNRQPVVQELVDRARYKSLSLDHIAELPTTGPNSIVPGAPPATLMPNESIVIIPTHPSRNSIPSDLRPKSDVAKDGRPHFIRLSDTNLNTTRRELYVTQSRPAMTVSKHRSHASTISIQPIQPEWQRVHYPNNGLDVGRPKSADYTPYDPLLSNHELVEPQESPAPIQIRRVSNADIVVPSRNQDPPARIVIISSNDAHHNYSSEDEDEDSSDSDILNHRTSRGFQRLHLVEVNSPKVPSQQPLAWKGSKTDITSVSVEHPILFQNEGPTLVTSSPSLLEAKPSPIPQHLPTSTVNGNNKPIKNSDSRKGVSRASEHSELSHSNSSRVSTNILRLQKELFGSNDVKHTNSNDRLNHFRQVEAQRLMQLFRLPSIDRNEISPQMFNHVPIWFHGKMSKYTAEQLLRNKSTDGCFLIRMSSNFPGYAISWFWDTQCHHQLVSVITPNDDNNSNGETINKDTSPQPSFSLPSYQLYSQTNSARFDSIVQLVRYYSTNSLVQAGRQFLLHPIGQQPNKTGLPDYVDLFYPRSIDSRVTRNSAYT